MFVYLGHTDCQMIKWPPRHSVISILTVFVFKSARVLINSCLFGGRIMSCLLYKYLHRVVSPCLYVIAGRDVHAHQSVVRYAK